MDNWQLGIGPTDWTNPNSYGVALNMGDDDQQELFVWSVILKRYFYGQTLTLARAQRSEAERVYREHHAKNSD